MIFDTYAHYDDEALDADHKGLLGSPRGVGITSVVNMAASPDGCVTILKSVETYNWTYAAQGIHPSEMAELDEEKIRWIRPYCTHEKVKVMREIGLGCYWEEPDYSIQKKWFVCQLDLARRTRLPVIIHNRDATKDTLDIVKTKKAGNIGGVIHCLSYGKEITREYPDMGLFLGIGGVVTSNNAKKLKGVVEYAPLKSFVLETDCPYLTPVLNRGKCNSSLNLTYVVGATNGIKGVNGGTVMKTAWKNTLHPYRISPISTPDV